MTYLVLKASQKFPALIQILQKMNPTPGKSIVFLNTCDSVKYFFKVLPAIMPKNFTLIPLHGKLEPNAREKNFTKFLTATSPTILLCTDVAARGLDIPQVDLVVQDPPSDPKTYVHRAGRAGRAGRRGLAVVMLHPGREEDFIPFLEIRKTPALPLTEPAISVSEQEAETAAAKIRAMALADREVHTMSHRAFPSWVRSYIEHRAKSIFVVGELDWADLAKQYGLLQLPKMPEFKGLNIDRTLGLGIDIQSIPFKDKAKEKKRQAALAERKASGVVEVPGAGAERAAAQKKKNEAWSGKAEREDDRRKRREKKEQKREKRRIAGLSGKEMEEQRKLEELIAQVRRKNEEAEKMDVDVAGK